MTRQVIKFELSHLQDRDGLPLSPEEQEVIKKAIRDNFDARYNQSSTGRAYELNQFRSHMFEGAQVAIAYADYEEFPWIGVERRKYVLTLHSTPGSMMVVYHHSYWTLSWKMEPLARCSCHPEYKGTGEWLCDYCFSLEYQASKARNGVLVDAPEYR